MKNYSSVVILCVLGLSLASGIMFTACSTEPQTESLSDFADELQGVLDETLPLHDGVGVSAAVLVPGRGFWTGASGISHGSVTMEPNMKFGIGSIAKNFMATLVLQLVEEGVLSLDDPLHRWLPPFPNVNDAITVRQLLNHTSGIHDFTENPSWGESILADLNRIWSAEETINTFVLQPVFEVGTGYEYSNTNYLLVGLIIREATQTGISTLLRDRILTPVGLENTFFGAEEAVLGATAHPWADLNRDGQREDISTYSRSAYDSMLWTCGALYSTAEDVVRYSSAVFDLQFFSEDSLASMLDYVPYPHNPALGYGFGILIIPDFLPDVQAVGHDGTVHGYKARWVYMPDHGVHIAVLLNEDNYDCLTDITAELARIVLYHL